MSEETRRTAATEAVRDSSVTARVMPDREILQIYEFGPFRLDAVERKLLRANQIVALTPRAFDTLYLLVRNSGHVLEKDQLMRVLWPGTFVEEGSLSNHIFLLRKALGDSQALIETVPRRGYRFVGAVRQVSVLDAAPAGNPPEVGTLCITSVRTKAQRPSRRRTALATVAAAMMVCLAGAGWLYRATRGTETIDSVAVLPFVNATADPETEYLSDGITESLIDSLSQLPHLKVMSRDAAFRYKDKETDARSVGRELGVRAIFKGRVTQSGDSVTIATELIDARDNSHIWGQRYIRKQRDVFGLQQEIAKEMAIALRLRPTSAEQNRLARNYTPNPDAYQDYLRGRYFWQQTGRVGLNKGAEYFQQAIAKDPGYAQAYDGLADCYIWLAVFGFSSPQEAYPKAKEAALKSLEIDNTFAEAHTSLARIKAEYDWDWSGAEREFQRALELNPGYSTAYLWHGSVLATMGRPEDAIANYRRSLELDPLSPIINGSLGQAFYYTRRYDDAIEQEQKTLELDPNLGLARSYLAYAYLFKSMKKETIDECEKRLIITQRHVWAIANCAYTYAVLGRRADAQKLLGELNEVSSERFVPADAMAQVYTGLGEKAKAFEWLEKGYERHSLGLGGVALKVDPVWDPLRGDPRFAELLRRTNLQF